MTLYIKIYNFYFYIYNIFIKKNNKIYIFKKINIQSISILSITYFTYLSYASKNNISSFLTYFYK